MGELGKRTSSFVATGEFPFEIYRVRRDMDLTSGLVVRFSMGGILAADAIRNIASSRADVKALLWPRVIGLIAFDTPYLGLHPNVFKHTFTKAATNIQAAKELASSIGLLAPAFMTGANAVFPSWSTKSPPTETTEPPTGLRDANPSGRPGSTRTPSDRPDGIVSDQPKASSGGWASKWTKGTPLVYGIGAAAVAAGAAGAYYKREHLGLGMGWAQVRETVLSTGDG